MGSRVTYPPYDTSDSGGEGGFPPNLDFQVNAGVNNLVLSDITEFNKIEIEFGLKVPVADKIMTGRATVIWNGSIADFTSYEQEYPNGEFGTVVITPYINGNNLGVTITNTSGEVFAFYYNFVNKFIL